MCIQQASELGERQSAVEWVEEVAKDEDSDDDYDPRAVDDEVVVDCSDSVDDDDDDDVSDHNTPCDAGAIQQANAISRYVLLATQIYCCCVHL